MPRPYLLVALWECSTGLHSAWWFDSDSKSLCTPGHAQAHAHGSIPWFCVGLGFVCGLFLRPHGGSFLLATAIHIVLYKHHHDTWCVRAARGKSRRTTIWDQSRPYGHRRNVFCHRICVRRNLQRNRRPREEQTPTQPQKATCPIGTWKTHENNRERNEDCVERSNSRSLRLAPPWRGQSSRDGVDLGCNEWMSHSSESAPGDDLASKVQLRTDHPSTKGSCQRSAGGKKRRR